MDVIEKEKVVQTKIFFSTSGIIIFKRKKKEKETTPTHKSLQPKDIFFFFSKMIYGRLFFFSFLRSQRFHRQIGRGRQKKKAFYSFRFYLFIYFHFCFIGCIVYNQTARAIYLYFIPFRKFFQKSCFCNCVYTETSFCVIWRNVRARLCLLLFSFSLRN